MTAQHQVLDVLDATELLPCPFCGMAVTLKRGTEDKITTFLCPPSSPCIGTGLGVFSINTSLPQAIAAWNRRAPPPPSEVRETTQGSEPIGYTDGVGLLIPDDQAARFKSLWDAVEPPPIGTKLLPLYAATLISTQEKVLAEMREALKPALADIATERERQKAVEGWTAEHDDQHVEGQLADAAACYAAPHRFLGKIVQIEWTDASRYMDARSEPIGQVVVPSAWPWDGGWFKLTGDTRRDLVKAGALIVAEIERLDRQALKGDHA